MKRSSKARPHDYESWREMYGNRTLAKHVWELAFQYLISQRPHSAFRHAQLPTYAQLIKELPFTPVIDVENAESFRCSFLSPCEPFSMTVVDRTPHIALRECLVEYLTFWNRVSKAQR